MSLEVYTVSRKDITGLRPYLDCEDNCSSNDTFFIFTAFFWGVLHSKIWFLRKKEVASTLESTIPENIDCMFFDFECPIPFGLRLISLPRGESVTSHRTSALISVWKS